MQQMLSNMEQRFNAMFGQGQGMQNVSEMQNIGGMQSSSSVISSQSGFEGNGDFFGGLFQQPCRQTFNENELVIKCNVTGYDPNEIKVDVKGNQLTIAGKRVEENPDGQNSTTQFQQSLLLSDYNMEKLTSDTSNGVLTVSVPRIPHQITDEKKNQSAVDIA
jgi:HSP20 family molecular chaperone IbpA